MKKHSFYKMWMGLFSILGINLILTLPNTSAIKCYRCTISKNNYENEPDQPCHHFDESSRYYYDCPYSTFCMKRISHYRLSNGTIVTTAERNCAPQKYLTHNYNYGSRQWAIKENVDELAYAEGCFEGNNRGTPNGPSEYCYCSSDYCNGSTTIKVFSFGALVITAFVTIKSLICI